MINIWLINHYAYPPKYAFSTRHHDLFSCFDSKKYKITIFCSNFLHFQKCYANQSEEKINNLNFVYIQTISYKKNNIKRLFNIISFYINFFKIAKRYDAPNIIYASSLHQLAWIAGIKIARKFKVPFISEVRDLWPQTLIDLGYISNNNLISIILRKVERFVYSRSDLIISLLPYAHEYINDLIETNKEVVCIPNGIDYEKFIEKRDLYQYKLESYTNLLTKPFICMYIGSLGPANNPILILRTAKLLKNQSEIKFIIAGDGVLKEKCEEYIRENGLLNVELLGRIDNKYIPSLAEKADIFLLPSIVTELYRFGVSLNKMLTYLCAEKPIILSADFRNSSIDESKGGFITKPDDANEFAEAILKMKQLPEEEREQMGLRNRDLVIKKYDIKKLANNLENEINKLL